MPNQVNAMSSTITEKQLCKICLTSGKISYSMSKFDLLTCPSCSHFFSCVKATNENYKDDYFFSHKKEYFAHPDIKLFKYLRGLIEKFHSGKKDKLRLLDVGTGMGTIPQYFSRFGFTIHGIDISEAAVRYGMETLKIADLKAVAIEDYRPDFAYDVVISNNVMEHVPDPVVMFGEIRRVLKDDGIFLCVTVDSGSLIFSIAKFIFRITNGILYKSLERICDVHHLHHFNQASLEHGLNKTGFRVVYRFGWDLPLNSIELSGFRKIIVGILYGFSTILASHFLQGVVCVKK